MADALDTGAGAADEVELQRLHADIPVYKPIKMILRKIKILVLLLLSLPSYAKNGIEKIYFLRKYNGTSISFYDNGMFVMSFSEHTAHTGKTNTIFSGYYRNVDSMIYIDDFNHKITISLSIQSDTVKIVNGVIGMIGNVFVYKDSEFVKYPIFKSRNPIDTIQSAHIYRKEIPNGIFSLTEPKYIDYIKHDYWIEFSKNSYSLYWKNILFFSGTVSYDDECNILLNTYNGKYYKARWVNNKAIFIDNFFSEFAEFYMN